MRRILVPLDGSTFAEGILSDARRYAGPGGVLILALDAGEIHFDDKTGTHGKGTASQEAHAYLHRVADRLRAEGGEIETVLLRTPNVPSSINLAAGLADVNMIACATHGEGPMGRLLWGSVAWEALVRSRVPVLLRHAEDSAGSGDARPAEQRKIMVPLDGSPFAEIALRVAGEFASEWKASLLLVSVTAGSPIAPHPEVLPLLDATRERFASVRSYLENLAAALPGEVETEVCEDGRVVHALVSLVKDEMVTDVVLSSHGHSGLSRVILGSVADGLIHRLHCPIVVIPATATLSRSVTRETIKRAIPVS